jgi:deoxyribodipyrimidine photo-lyase
VSARSPGVPPLRLRVLADRQVRPGGEYVVYWMTAARRLSWNYALDRSIELAREARRPLVVVEALRCGYRWASDRIHALVLQGMADNARRAERSPLLYHPYVEPEPGAGKGLIEALSERAVAIVADDSPVFFLPRILAAAAARVRCRLEAVDSDGLLPTRAADRVFTGAHPFRRFLQRELPRHLLAPPRAEPLRGLRLPRLAAPPAPLAGRWPAADAALLGGTAGALARLPIDHAVPPVAALGGGTTAAELVLRGFLEERLGRYAEGHNHPDDGASSGLSPWLHFGHLSPHQVLAELAARERWSAETLSAGGDGSRAGWWGMSASAEAFLDELVTWRELGRNFSALAPDACERYDSLPAWALATLAAHRGDPRRWTYGIAELAAAATHDELWNAAQRQLRGEGRIHNYLRMLWGKKVIEWSQTPEVALANLFELNDRWALDGRDPNSASGILWCFGRYDRAWGPVRPVFGTVRYLSSDNTRRKLRLKRYLSRWAASE